MKNGRHSHFRESWEVVPQISQRGSLCALFYVELESEMQRKRKERILAAERKEPES